MTTSSIPETLEEVTPEWLSAVLAPHFGPEVRVATISGSPVGKGIGTLSRLWRISVEYVGKSAGAPPTFILKLPTPVQSQRVFGGTFNAYGREVGFYRDCSGEAGIRVPRCYHAAVETASNSFALLLEDTPTASPGNQQDSCSDDQAALAVSALAGLHARWWQNERLPELPWVPAGNAPELTIVETLFATTAPTFDRWNRFFDPAFMRVVQRLAADPSRILEATFSRPFTLAHGDYRLDNILFGPAGSPEELVVVDWQLCGRLPGAIDFHYFVWGNLGAESADRLEDHLSRLYVEGLARGGVRDYTLDNFRRDSAAAALWLTAQTVVGLSPLDPDALHPVAERLVRSLFAPLSTVVERYDAESLL